MGDIGVGGAAPVGRRHTQQLEQLAPSSSSRRKRKKEATKPRWAGGLESVGHEAEAGDQN